MAAVALPADLPLAAAALDHPPAQVPVQVPAQVPAQPPPRLQALPHPLQCRSALFPAWSLCCSAAGAPAPAAMPLCVLPGGSAAALGAVLMGVVLAAAGAVPAAAVPAAAVPAAAVPAAAVPSAAAPQTRLPCRAQPQPQTRLPVPGLAQSQPQPRPSVPRLVQCQPPPRLEGGPGVSTLRMLSTPRTAIRLLPRRNPNCRPSPRCWRHQTASPASCAGPTGSAANMT